ncbi:MAG: M20/M25/M40 family metallo-hydrolase [Deltaproteobacteria bacterium]|nr:M20/M25/M40 family metallo-hydrolase [Deltaproteobacteria bacterium]
MPSLPEILCQLIRFDTQNPGGNERALAEHIAERLSTHHPDELALVDVPGREGPRNGAYVYARWGTPRVVVNAHVDTVPRNLGWTSDPLTARIDNGRVIGLGAADTKGAIACLLACLEETRPRDLAFLFSGDEERNGTCVRAFLKTPAARGIVRAIACEPTGCRVGTRHRGILALEARFQGEGGHSSRADFMPAPIAELARLAVALADWGRERRDTGPPGFPGMCMNVAKLEGGVAFNVVPDAATLCFSLRPPPGTDTTSLGSELFNLAHRVVPSAQVRVALDNPPFATRNVQSFMPLLGQAVVSPMDLSFWTEAAVFASAGMDAVVFGPGDVSQAHAPGEWVSIGDLEDAKRIFARMFHGAV